MNYGFEQDSIPHRFGKFFAIVYVIAVIAIVIAFSTYAFAFENICFLFLSCVVNLGVALYKSSLLSDLAVRDTLFSENLNCERVKKAKFTRGVETCGTMIYFMNYIVSSCALLTVMLLFEAWWYYSGMEKDEYLATMIVNMICCVLVFLFGNYIAKHSASIFGLLPNTKREYSNYDFDLNKTNVNLLGERCENYATTMDYSKRGNYLKPWVGDIIWLWVFVISIGMFAGKLSHII